MRLDSFALGWSVSLALNALALAPSLAIAARLKPEGRAELVVATTMLWNFLVMVPVYALGLTGHLSPRPLAWTSALFFGAVYVAVRGRRGRAMDRDVFWHAVTLLRLVSDTALRAVRARGVVSVVVVFTICMVSWTMLCAYYTPSWKQWDALWYHEPIVGFTIQNHGFHVVDLPATGGAQKINGYPRLAEMTQLWFVIFMDRRVIDMVNHVMTPALMASVYLLARRSASEAVSLGLGAAILCMPACANLLGSSYVDVHNAAFIVAGVHFATRPTLRLRDAWMAALCLGLGVASKHMAVIPALTFGLIAAARVLARARGRAAAAVGTVLGGIGVIAGCAAPTYYRNWKNFKNPLWPEFKLDSDRFNIHWQGAAEWGAGKYDVPEVQRLDMNEPIGALMGDLYRIPYSINRGHMTQAYEYGLGITSVVLPVTFFVVLLLAMTPLRDLGARVFRRPAWRASGATRNAALLAVGLLPMLYFSPALWGARYQIAAVGVALGLVGWAAGRGGEGRGHGLAAAIGVGSIVSFFWAEPRFYLWWSEAKAFAAVPYPEREVTQATSIDPALDAKMGSAIMKDIGMLREKQLGPGAVLAFNSAYGTFMGLFWNNEFSNRIVWVPEGPDYLERVAATGATWTYCAYADPTYSKLKDKDSGWTELGTVNVEHWGAMFRRTKWD